MPQIAQTDQQIMDCFNCMAQLRPHLVESEFIEQIRLMQNEGYQLAYLQHEQQVACVAGFRIGHNFHLGKYLYVDDLSTDENYRSQGFGRQMLEWLRQLARDNQCQAFHLDSGTQRLLAHRFYFRHGLSINSFHFNQSLVESDGQ